VLPRQAKGRSFHDWNSRDLHVQKTCDIAQCEIVIVITLENELRECAAELTQHGEVIFRAARGLLFFLFQIVVKFLKNGALAIVKRLCGAAERQQPAQNSFGADAKPARQCVQLIIVPGFDTALLRHQRFAQ
jgi:hypothetical protein